MNININKKYTTRKGLPVRIYATDAGGNRPVHGAMWYGGIWIQVIWTATGENFSGSEHDLIPVKTWRAWKSEEVPKFFMIRHKEIGSRLGVEAAKIIGDNYLKLLFEDYVWVHEDGSESVCGVAE